MSVQRLSDNPHEALAREVKAGALADSFTRFARRAIPGVTPARVVELAGAAEVSLWRDVAEVSGINPPSAATIARTIALLGARAVA